ncbi:MAG: FAD-dependent oxidoreductase [Clostridia bacterium]|nr:FAD-dependent oxidoreductase [Clostridia bacterium]MDD4375822.1 FAD-dependent oxidoreductase [Clostridia bacterium]
MKKEIVIVGGVAGGATAATRIRRLDEEANITVLEQGEYVSFANCGLPYYIGGDIKSKKDLLLQTPEGFKKRYNIDVRIKHKAIKIDEENSRVKVLNIEEGIEEYKNYDKLILSTGAEPIKIFKDVNTIRNIPDIEEVQNKLTNAKSAIIIGGGYIGLEMAENIYKKGISVTIIEKSEHLIASIDKEMANILHKYLESKGVKLLLNTTVKTIEKGIVKLEDGKEIKADMIISAIGVRPDVTLLEGTKIKIGELGGVVVNEYMQTTSPNIYAIGDMVEVINNVTNQKALIPLASPANKQARIVADNICGINSKYTGSQGTAILKIFDMVVASTGPSEKTLKHANIQYLKSYTHSYSNATYYPGAKLLSIKLLWNKENKKLLGTQIVGFKGVDKRIDVIATAIKFGLTPENLTEIELAYAPPFSSAKDPINVAGYVASNIIKETSKVFYPEDINKLNLKEVTLLDVRTKHEYNNGTIEGAINIPLDELRERFNEISKDKNIYVFCAVGQRGYLAERILKANGFKNVKNLNGGYYTYLNNNL